MKLISKTGLRNAFFVGGMLVISAGYYAHSGYSNSTGITGQSKLGCTCHGGGVKSDNTTVELVSPVTEYEAGKTYYLTLTVRNAARPAAGFDASRSTALDSKIDTVSTDKTVKSTSSKRDITHRSPKSLVDGVVSWNFKYTAPTTLKNDTIFVAANAVNDNGNDDTGDQWTTTRFILPVVTAGVEGGETVATERFTLSPNPASNFTKLNFDLGRSMNLHVAMFNTAGKIVMTQDLLQAMGKGEMSLHLSDLPMGEYFVHVSTSGKMLYTGKISHVK